MRKPLSDEGGFFFQGLALQAMPISWYNCFWKTGIQLLYRTFLEGGIKLKRRIVTAAQMKEIERTGNAHGLHYLQMMENAGQAAYEQLQSHVPQGRSLLIVCGKGNNGGDGFVIARAAIADGWRVTVLLAEGDPKTHDAKTNYARLSNLSVTVCRDAAALKAQSFDVVVDALYGTGFHGSLRPTGLVACALMNRQRKSGAFVLAIDLPSGINTDIGEVADGAVHADLTVTFDSFKPLHMASNSASYCGEVVCADIGILDEWHPIEGTSQKR